MAITVNSPIALPPEPNSRAGMPIVRGTAAGGGFSTLFRSCNTIFEQKKPSFVNDWAPDGIYGGKTSPSYNHRWRARVAPYAGWTGSAAVALVYLFVVKSAGGGATWPMTLYNDTASTSLAITPLSATTGTWYAAGSIQYDDTSAYNTWRLVQGTTSGLTSADFIRGISIIPARSASALPSVVGGYSDAAAGITGFDASISYGPSQGAHTWILRNGHKMLRYLWSNRIGQIVTSSFEFHLWDAGKAGAGGTQVMFKGLQMTPHKCTSATFWIYTAKTNINAYVYVDDTLAGSSVVSAGWGSIQVDVTPNALQEFRVESSDDMQSICAYYDDAEY